MPLISTGKARYGIIHAFTVHRVNRDMTLWVGGTNLCNTPLQPSWSGRNGKPNGRVIEILAKLQHEWGRGP